MRRSKFLIIFILAFNYFVILSSASAEKVINITRGSVSAIPIAINNFMVDGNYISASSKISHNNPSNIDLKRSQEIISIIKDDLKNSGVFRPISNAAFIENKVGVKHTPLFAAWQQINASLLLNASLERDVFGNLEIKFILWDSFLEQQMLAGTVKIDDKEPRRAAHQIADQIYSKLTGFEGYFDSKIVYVSESGPYLKRIKRIAIMDQDGANHQYLTDGSDLVLTPRFSPDGKKIIYLSYKNNTPKVYEMDLSSKKIRLVGNFPGMSFAPRFSPDGKSAIMSVAKNGSTHIYEIDLKTKKTNQLTYGDDIDTSPSYSYDGKHIVFNSDRYGSRHLFIMDRDGSNVKRVSKGGGAMAEPSWSKNDYIAFTKISRNHGFTIGVMKADPAIENANLSNDERLITKGYLVESPAWSPNGRHIIFTRGNPPKFKTTNQTQNRNSRNKADLGPDLRGLNKIYSIDFTGYNEHQIPTPNDASDPDWSSLR